MRKLASAVHKLKKAPWYADCYRTERRREVAKIAESILLKMEICDEVIARSVSHEFADYAIYCKANERWDWLYNRGRDVMREQWG